MQLKSNISVHMFSCVILVKWTSWQVFVSPLVCPPLRVDVLLQEYPCLHGRVSPKMTSGGASIAASTWMAGKPIWYPT